MLLTGFRAFLLLDCLTAQETLICCTTKDHALISVSKLQEVTRAVTCEITDSSRYGVLHVKFGNTACSNCSLLITAAERIIEAAVLGSFGQSHQISPQHGSQLAQAHSTAAYRAPADAHARKQQCFVLGYRPGPDQQVDTLHRRWSPQHAVEPTQQWQATLWFAAPGACRGADTLIGSLARWPVFRLRHDGASSSDHS